MFKNCGGIFTLKRGLTAYCIVFVVLLVIPLSWSVITLLEKPSDQIGKIGFYSSIANILCTLYLLYGVLKEDHEYILPILIWNACLFMLSSLFSILLGFVNNWFFLGLPITVFLWFVWHRTYLYYRMLLEKEKPICDNEQSLVDSESV